MMTTGFSILMLGAVPWFGALTFLFFLLCLALIFLVLIQKGADQGGGLGQAFGGGGGAESLFGVKTVSGVKYLTAGLAILFMVMSILLAKLSTYQSQIDSGLGDKPLEGVKVETPVDEPTDEGAKEQPEDGTKPAGTGATETGGTGGETPKNDGATPPAEGGATGEQPAEQPKETPKDEPAKDTPADGTR